MAQSPETEAPQLAFDRLAEIAVGATAQIELCRVTEGPRAGQLLVIKRLHPQVADDPQFVDMFRDEVWMTAALEHKHVVQVIGWGVDDTGPYLAVEFVRGVSLARLMKTVFETGEQFTERQVVYLGHCICDGLAAAHSLRSPQGELLNLVHRDMTPGNVLLGFDGQVKIADFGLAKARMRLTKTMTGLLKGQPHYMAPEQIKSQRLDGRTDIFALGVVLYELFAGRRPWSATSDLEAMRAALEQDPAPLADLRPAMDKALVALVDKCLQKDPAARFQSADLLRDEFNNWLLAHGYREDNEVALARFVRRNAMRQMRWFDRAIAGHFAQGPTITLEDSDGATASAQGGERAEAVAFQSVPPGPPGAAHVAGAPAGGDWGDEGPTLIQDDQQAKDALRPVDEGGVRSTRPRPRARRRLPTSPTRPAMNAAGSEGALAIADEPSIPETTTVRRQGKLGAGPPSPSQPPAGPSAPPPPGAVGASQPPPGVVVPPDPNVPPVPPPSASGGVAAVASASLGTDPVSGVDLVVEAQRLAKQAADAAESARQAAVAADAAARSAALAGEALLLAASGQQPEALERLQQARQVEAQVASGPVDLPAFIPLAGMSPQPRWLRNATLRRMHAGLVNLLSREGVALGGVLLLGVLLVLLFWALLR